jgi:D-alanyl-D-alanine carboxypeptidase/D-alanyl-D-alanine-endopeptidase (penicillin-binding protein 4)
VPITHVVLDSTYWDSADSWNSTWDRSLRTNGEVGEVTALQVDGDRDDPTQEISRRSTDPVARAGKAFVAALGLSGVTTREGAAEDGAPVLATVKSATVATLVQQMLRLGDATLAESLARVVSLKSNLSGSAASLQQAIPLALQKEGMDTQDLTIADGSGLSSDDAVSATFMAALMAKIAQGGALQSISDGLPVAAKTGSLSTRFTGNAAVSGNLDGVTGSIDGSRSLAGSVKAADGTTLAFSFIGVGPAITDDATTALDALAVGIYGCGNNLTNN